jgi:hypothetical protein
VVKKGALRANGMAQFNNLSADDVLAIRHYIRQQARKAIAKKQASRSTQ